MYNVYPAAQLFKVEIHLLFYFMKHNRSENVIENYKCLFYVVFFDKIVQFCRASAGVIARHCGNLVEEYTKSTHFLCFIVIY